MSGSVEVFGGTSVVCPMFSGLDIRQLWGGVPGVEIADATGTWHGPEGAELVSSGPVEPLGMKKDEKIKQTEESRCILSEAFVQNANPGLTSGQEVAIPGILIGLGYRSPGDQHFTFAEERIP